MDGECDAVLFWGGPAINDSLRIAGGIGDLYIPRCRAVIKMAWVNSGYMHHIFAISAWPGVRRASYPSMLVFDSRVLSVLSLPCNNFTSL